MHHIARLTLAALTATTLTACTTTNAGTPTTTSTTKSSAKPSGPGELDLQRFTSDPCSIVSTGDLATFGKFAAPKAEADGPNGPSCAWDGKDPLEDSSYQVVLVVKGATLESFREANKSRKVFRETTIAGYPAISYDTASGTLDCNTAIGTSDKEAVLIQATVGDSDKTYAGKPCDAAEKFGTTVMSKLKP
ncbi:DUF3558 domain-containing protein [Saccharothrix variisporea]|uniref:Uncharacterized protein DUF3558 n=1 Tax=Saccharothrix variisporea TaxID=543527 RepID=A0A495XA79_9PSEU|nr:DUF3558 domain-containing protein [Saccharothrix variisporea]RKT70276.1 uncharacterized protein DUF3558 [Saccharothrix variisporea]